VSKILVSALFQGLPTSRKRRVAFGELAVYTDT
jgi:hypothetical protein